MVPHLPMLDAGVSGTSVEREREGEGKRGAANGRDLEAGAKDRIAIAEGEEEGRYSSEWGLVLHCIASES